MRLKNWQQNKSGIYVSSKQDYISYPKDGNENSYLIEKKSLWFNQRNELIYFFVKKYGLIGDFLDIGGGNGFQASYLNSKDLKGKIIVCEPGFTGCLNSKKNGVKWVFNGFFEDFPFKQFEIKSIGLFDVIEHIDDDIIFLRKLFEKIDKGTRIFINVPAFNHLWSRTDEYTGHFRRYNLTDIDRIINSTKFKLIDHSFFFSQFYFPLLFARVLPDLIGLRGNKKSILSQERKNLNEHSSFFNKVLNFFHKKQILRLKRNKKIKIGTSLFFVLEK